MIILFKTLIFLILFNFQNVWGESANTETFEKSYKLASIEFVGNSKTTREVLLTELELSVGQTYRRSEIEAAVNEVRNTNLFSDVSLEIIGEQQQSTLKLSLKERWTTIPIFKFAAGGGVTQTTIGVYDPNIFGRYIESGMQFERLGDVNSGVIWFKKPRLFGSKNGIDLQYWNTNRIRTKYLQDVDELELKTGFLHQREKIYLGYGMTFTKLFSATAFYEYNKDVFSEDFLEDDVKAKILTTGLPIDTETHFVGLSLSYGKINHRSYLLDGSKMTASFRQGFVKPTTEKNFWHLDLTYSYYKTLIKDWTFAQRVLSGLTTTDLVQYWNYVGGLDAVRGYADGRFAGRYYWLSNTEIRVPLIKTKTVIFQAVGFVDITSTDDFIERLNQVDGASVGAGARFILPKVYRFVVRLDYAKTVVKTGENSISFGVQQFF